MHDITMSCPHCGELLEAPRDYIGESVACPTCQTEFEISDQETPAEAVPQTGTKDAALSDEGNNESICPNCEARMTADSVLCLACGFHTGLGKVIETNFE